MLLLDGEKVGHFLVMISGVLAKQNMTLKFDI